MSEYEAYPTAFGEGLANVEWSVPECGDWELNVIMISAPQEGDEYLYLDLDEADEMLANLAAAITAAKSYRAKHEVVETEEANDDG